MNLPVLSKRREQREAKLAEIAERAADQAIEKALAPAMAGAPNLTAVGGATYPVPNPSSPFNQTGGNYGAMPLPRPPGDFDSLFGPGYPLFPDALDPLRPDGRADPRRWEYPVTWNIQLVDRALPWSALRRVASEVDVVARCIELIQDAIAGMSWSWGFSRQIINQIRAENNEPNSAKATVLARDKYGDELDRVQKFFARPDERMGYTFIQWLTGIVWSHLVYDAIVIYPSYTLKGELHSLSTLDPSTIKILLDNQGFLPQPPAPAYQQILYGFPRGEFQAEAADDGTIPGGYRQDQLAYYLRRPRFHTPYGFSTVEECVNYATLYQQRQEWMHAEWTHGVTPKLVIETSGTETWTPDQMAYYQNALNDQWSGQTQRRQQLMMLRPGMKPTQLKEMTELYNSDYDQWLVMQIAAKFGVPQSQMGVPMALHNLGSGVQNISSMDLTDKFALDALVNFLADCINDLARRFMGIGPEISIVAADGNSNEADLQSAQADASDVNNGIRTRNEVRAERGIPLITEPEADELGVTTATGVTFLTGQLAAQEAQLEILEGGADATTDTATTTAPRQRSSRLDAPADPAVKPTGRKPDGVSPTGRKDRPHKPRRYATKPRASTKVSGAHLSERSVGGNYVEKELAAFTKFAKSRIERGSWRDFEFEYVAPHRAGQLNAVGAAGSYELVKDAATATPTAAGLVVRADNTGRVLMVQRSIENHNERAAGLWEWPGGKIDDNDESPLDAAQREWEEEVGGDLPDGKVVGSWLTPNGRYEAFVYLIDDEDDLELDNARGLDGSGDKEIENVAWWKPGDIVNNPAMRVEVQSADWSLLGNSKSLDTE